MRTGLNCRMQLADTPFLETDTTAVVTALPPVHPGLTVLRRAIRENAVSFPSRVPILLKGPPGEMQWRSVLLYFVRGWTATAIAARFHVPVHRIWHILNQWAIRATALGYIQIIDVEAFCRLDAGASGSPVRRTTALFATRGGWHSGLAS